MYRSRAAMLADVNLLYTNSVQYNGESHLITATAAKIVQICKEQFEEHAEQFDALEKNLEQQAVAITKSTDQLTNDDDWQQMTTDPTTNFTFNAINEGRKSTRVNRKENFDVQILEMDDPADLKSPTSFGMSLETFIARDFSVIEHNLQEMETEEKEENNDEPLDATEKITTEDILGNISESDSDDDDEKSSPMGPGQSQQDEANAPPTESSSTDHQHKHSKKRLKTSHPSTSADAAALQLSEDEL